MSKVSIPELESRLPMLATGSRRELAALLRLARAADVVLRDYIRPEHADDPAMAGMDELRWAHAAFTFEEPPR